MKKKGLIISTVVMAVILIASLTSATYAWFSITANVSVSDIQIVTKASDGLQIASYYEGNYYNGSLTLLTDEGVKYWGQESPSGFGSTLVLGTEGAEQLEDIFACSGDGATLFMNADEQQDLLATGKPETLVLAGANSNYLALDFAIQNTSAENSLVYIDNITVTPTDTIGMAGSIRIAVFSTTTDPTTSYPAYTVADNGIICYDPYYNISKGSLSWSEIQDTNKYALTAGDYTASGVMSTTTLQSLWSTKYIGATLAATNWDSTGIKAAELSKNFFTTSDDVKTSDNKTVLASSVAPRGAVWVRLVIWFDGEDSACVQSTAGGGITVSLSFAKQTAAE